MGHDRFGCNSPHLVPSVSLVGQKKYLVGGDVFDGDGFPFFVCVITRANEFYSHAMYPDSDYDCDSQ